MSSDPAASTSDDTGPPSVETAAPRPPSWDLALAVVLFIVTIGLAGAAGFHHLFLQDLPQIPDKAALWSYGRPPGMTFIGPDGRVVAHRGPRHGELVRLADLPPHVAMAFLAAEDRRFYEHGALDLRGVARAAARNLRAGRALEGGSTLTQQLARGLFLRPEKTLKRKVQEAVLASRLERMLSKDEILELYLNRVYFGDRAYGLAAAARTYFAKPASDLTLAESALLASLPKAPTRLALTNDMPAAWARATSIVGAMSRSGWISSAQADAALQAPPPLAPAEVGGEGDMAWVLDAAARQAEALTAARSPDLVIHLTVDPAFQAQAAAILRQSVRSEGRRVGARQGALVALAPDGAVRAMVGGVDPVHSAFNRATQARRQPGSAFKPFVWAAALEQGVRPYELRADAAIRIGGWSPRNYGGGYHGMVTVERALRQSLNTVSVRLAREAGLDRVSDVAHRFGLVRVPEHPAPSIALGAYEVTLLELTSAYQVLQNGGGLVRPYLISQITNARGDTLYLRPASAPIPVYPEFQAAQMVRMMQGVITDGTGVRADFGRPAAGKTGTSQSHRDAWFVGFTPDWVAGVWVGNDDNRPMAGVTGGRLPAQIWRRFMVAAHRGLTPRDFGWARQVPLPPPGWSPYAPEPEIAAPEDFEDFEPEGDAQPTAVVYGGDRPRMRTPRGEARIWMPAERAEEGDEEILTPPPPYGVSAGPSVRPSWPADYPF